MTPRAPHISPYIVQYPSASSVLLPVFRTNALILLATDIRILPRILAWRFSSANPDSVPLKKQPISSIKTLNGSFIDMLSNLIPRLSANSFASVLLCSEEKEDGIDTPITFSLPIASTAIAAVSDESIPPLRPITAFLKPVLLK